MAETTRSAGDRHDTDPADVPPAPVALSAGDGWGSLRVIEELGRGSFGRVYRAWDDTLAREVALKIIRLPRQDPDLAAAVLHEGQMLARVRHANVVSVYGALQLGGEIGLWMELIKGRRLADIVRTDGPMSADEAAVVAASLCHALSAVHGAGLLHRDLKAHNVMREAGGRIVLMDFGAGRDIAGVTGASDYTGTPLYMAPEVLAGRPASAASDVYSLGVLLYFLVTARYPYEGATAADVAVAQGLGRRRLLADSRADLPDDFVQVVERAIDPSLRRRYGSAGAMLEELAQSAQATPRVWRAGDSGTAGAALESRPPGPSIAARTAGVAVVVLAAIWFFGFLTSMTFDTTLEIEPEFAQRSPTSWLFIGLQSMVSPVVYTAIFVVLFRVLLSAARLLLRVVPRARTFHLRSRVSRFLGRLGLWDPANAAQLVVVLQVAALAIVWWSFRDYLTAVFSLLASSADAPKLAPLGPANIAPLYYRMVLTLAIAVMVAVWYRLLTAKAGMPPDRPTIAGGALAIVVAALMLQAPYKLVHQNYRPRADYAGSRCYLMGEQGSELLLFCPDNAPPRNQVVPAGDPRLHRTALPENIFVPASEARPVTAGGKD